MAAAEEDGLSDASVETVEQHPDRRGEPDEGGNEDTDGDGSGGDGGGSGESEHDDSESDTDDGGAEDHPAVVVTRNACGEGTLTVVSVALASSRSGKAPSKTQKYVYLRDLEYHLDGTAGRSTSRLPKKLANMGVSDTLRVVEAKSVRDGTVTHEEWTALLSVYMDMIRSRDALATTARRFTLVPTRVTAMVAQDEGNKYILLALGKQLPKKWAAAEAREEARAAGGVDFNAESVLEESEDLDELAEIALETELLTDFTSFQTREADERDARTYCLQKPSVTLGREIELFKAFRQKPICRFRTGAAVLSTSVSSDLSTLMRLLGYMKDHRPKQDGETNPPLTMVGVITNADLGRWVEQWSEWLKDRSCSHTTIANYVNSVVTLKLFTLSDAFEGGSNDSEHVYDELVRMRRQAHALAKQDQLWRPQDPQWLSWPQVMTTRLNADAAYKSAKGLQKRLVALRTLMVITAHSILPPDRVGTIRLLRIGHTLKLLDDEDGEGAEARYWIDYRSRANKHKTSRFYGASMTLLPPQMDECIKLYLALKAKFGKYDLESHDLNGQYLFTSTDDGSRPYPTSSWTKVVKDAFRQHSPGSKAPAPKTLRSIFITWMRSQCENDADMKEVLRSAAVTMKHRETTSGSDVYDKATHQKLTNASFEFTLRFARECEAAHARGEEIPTMASGTKLSSGSKGAQGQSSSSSRSSGGSGGGRTPQGGGRAGRGTRGGRSGRARGRGSERGRSDGTPIPPPVPPLSSSPNVDHLVGTTVRRSFDGTWFDGDVSYEDPYFRVTYSDGDAEDLTSLQLRFLADGVFEGAKISFHGGDLDGGWSEGTVVEPYQKKHGKLWVPKGYEWQSSAAHSWLVQYSDGVAAVALPTERKVEERADNPPGSWMSLSN